MASIPSGKPLTGEPDARNLPVRFGGRGSGQPLSLPLFYSSHPRHPMLSFCFFQRRGSQRFRQIGRAPTRAAEKNKKNQCDGGPSSYKQAIPSGINGFSTVLLSPP